MNKLALAGTLALATVVAHATVYDLATDYSTTTNPLGVWSYGYSNTLNGAFTAFDTYTTPNGYDRWSTNIDALGVYFNPSASTLSFSTVTVPGLQAWLHPGPNGQYAVARFTAPTAGNYSVNVGFFGADVVGTTTDVFVSLNGATQFSDSVSGFASAPTTSFNNSYNLNAGDTLDAIVSWGSNQTYVFDSTAVNFTVDGVPEPMTLVGLGALAAFTAKRRKRSV